MHAPLRDMRLCVHCAPVQRSRRALPTLPCLAQQIQKMLYYARGDLPDMSRVARIFEAVVFTSRWLVAPFLLGLVLGLAALVYKFILKLVEFIMQMPAAAPADVIVGILTLVDLTLVANLIVIVICSSYENFIARIDAAGHPDWPEGLVKIGFSDLKQKLLGSIAAIAAVNVLEWFMDIERHADNSKLAWVVGILLALAVAMLLLAIADRLGSSKDNGSRAGI